MSLFRTFVLSLFLVPSFAFAGGQVLVGATLPSGASTVMIRSVVPAYAAAPGTIMAMGNGGGTLGGMGSWSPRPALAESAFSQGFRNQMQTSIDASLARQARRMTPPSMPRGSVSMVYLPGPVRTHGLSPSSAGYHFPFRR